MTTNFTRRDFIKTTALGAVWFVTSAATVTLQWDPVTDADGYKIYWGTSSRFVDGISGTVVSGDFYDGTGVDPLIAGAVNSPFDVGNIDTGSLVLTPEHYYFAVTAYNDYGESGYSLEVDAVITPSGIPGHIGGIQVLTFNVPPPPGDTLSTVFKLKIA